MRGRPKVASIAEAPLEIVHFEHEIQDDDRTDKFGAMYLPNRLPEVPLNTASVSDIVYKIKVQASG